MDQMVDGWNRSIEEYQQHQAAIEAAGQVRGRHYTEWVPKLDQLRSAKRDDEQLKLLLEIIAATERVAAIDGLEPPPGYTKRAAVIYRRRKDYDAEVAILEPWLAACPPDRGDEELNQRLDKARLLRGGG